MHLPLRSLTHEPIALESGADKRAQKNWEIEYSLDTKEINPYFIKKGDGEPRTYFPVPEENQKEVDLDPWPGAEEVGTEKTCFIRQRSKIGESWSSPIL